MKACARGLVSAAMLVLVLAAVEAAEPDLAALAGGRGFAAALGSRADSLPAAEAAALLGEWAAKAASPEERRALTLRGAELCLLLGRFSEAAARYEEAASLPAGGVTELLVRAARCRLAAGDPDRARDLAASLVLAAKDPGQDARARLLGAWALIAGSAAGELRLSAARSIVETLLAMLPPGPPYAAERREGRFLLWVMAETDGRASALAALAKEFPGSPEALIAAGAMAPAPLPHWYIGSFAARGSPSAAAPQAFPAKPSPDEAVPTSPAAATASASSTAAATASASSPAPAAATAVQASAAAPSSFQVGYFAKEENAKRLQAELASKGFQATVVARPGAGPAGAKRWAVIVDPGKEGDGVGLKLKDAGYEAYPLF